MNIKNNNASTNVCGNKSNKNRNYENIDSNNNENKMIITIVVINKV